jgi:RHS repeat-associated protein
VSEFGWGGAWGYQSEYSDATQPGLGLVYMEQRYYDPALGRFISADPIGLEGGLNQYSYCENDPINRVDPSGTEWDWARAALDWLLGVFRVKVDPKAPTWRNRYRDASLETDEFIGRDVRRYNNGLGAAGAGACEAINVAGTEVIRAMGTVAGGSLVRNPWGRHGSPAHQDRVDAIREGLRLRGWRPVAGGTGLPERAIQVGNGRIRYPDLIMEKGGRQIAVQVGKRTKGGAPVWRERRALRDLRGSGAFRHVFFFEY